MSTQMVGSRELKVRLGTYLRRVRQGHRLVVTDRGRPVAELRPIERAADRASLLADLAARGIVTPATLTKLPDVRPVTMRGASLSAAIIEDREDRF